MHACAANLRDMKCAAASRVYEVDIVWRVRHLQAKLIKGFADQALVGDGEIVVLDDEDRSRIAVTRRIEFRPLVFQRFSQPDISQAFDVLRCIAARQ